jgi:hypothetical protein
MNILILYNSSQTYTNAVFEHLDSLRKYSTHHFFFSHADQASQLNLDLNKFDAVGIHFTIRLPFDQVSPDIAQALGKYSGLKFLFIQDEYDFPKKTWDWINRLSIQLVFTVVPEAGVETVYPSSEFPFARFVSTLTGYVPEKLPAAENFSWPSERQLMVGYRGRPLPVRYGQLGFEKVAIGAIVKEYCQQHNISTDIAWSEEARIYGEKWYEFIGSCRSMLGSESGSNVFDWNGDLNSLVDDYRKRHPRRNDNSLYCDLIQPLEIDGLMNQLSPRVFEAIASKTILVLFEGNYSGVIHPWEHYIPLKKDGCNLTEVMNTLSDGEFIDKMAKRAYEHVISSGSYSYKSFAALVDREIEKSETLLRTSALPSADRDLNFSNARPTEITTFPIRAAPPIADSAFKRTLKRILNTSSFRVLGVSFVWKMLPEELRYRIRKFLRKIT